MRKKVVHVVLRDYIDTNSYQEQTLSRKHQELGYEVSVITSQLYRDKNKKRAFHKVEEFKNKYGVTVTILPCKARNNFTGLFQDQVIGLYDKLCQIKPDIIFVHNFPYRDMRHIVRYVKNNPNVKVYADCHTDYYNSHYNSLQGKLRALFAKRQGHILNKVAIKFWGTTPWRVDFLKNVYKLPSEKIDLLISGADETHIININREATKEAIRAKYGIPKDAFLVITGGKLDKRKQQDLLMEAVKQLGGTDVWLIAFGTPSDDMVSVFQQYEGIKNIVMAGWVASEDTYSLFMASDLAFFPGTHSVLWEEAVACSIPLVVKLWSGMSYVNANGNALLLDNVSVETIKNTIVSLNRTDEYNNMLHCAKEVANKFYLKDIAYKAIGEKQEE
jgi:glycosyltransferase involved in cell wall biosynthesis